MAGHGIEPGPLTLESDALPIASGGPAQKIGTAFKDEGISFCSSQLLYLGRVAENYSLKVVIITNLEQKQKSA